MFAKIYTYNKAVFPLHTFACPQPLIMISITHKSPLLSE